MTEDTQEQKPVGFEPYHKESVQGNRKEPQKPKARLISLFSPKGGAGKTVLSVNLAVSLSQMGKKVLLLDFDLKAPLDIAKTINLNPKTSLFEVIPCLDKEQESLKRQLNSRIIPYSDHLHYLAAINRIRQLPHVKVDLVKKTFPILKQDYDFIVVDAGSDLTDVLISIFDYSNLISMLVTPDVLSVYKTEWCLDTLQSLLFPLGMIKVIINRAESKGSFSWQELRLVLPCEIVGMIPSDGKVVNYSLNRQVPAVLDAPQSRFSQSIKKLAADMVSRPEIFVDHELESRVQKSEFTTAGSAAFWKDQNLVEALPEQTDEARQQDEIVKLKQKIHQRLVNELNLEHMTQDVLHMKGEKYQRLRETVERSITNLLSEESGQFISSLEVRQKLIREIVDEALGLGPLESLLKEGAVTEIMVNNKDQIYVEREGKLYLSTKTFVTNQQIRTVIERIIAPLGRRIDESTPMVDARLPDGSRVNAIIPPLSLTGPTLTIRKFAKKKLTVRELIDKYDSLNDDMALFLEASVKARKNILVSGGTDSGKTTFLNILSEFISDRERVITIEDAAELKLHHSHWIRLESRPPNIEGKGEVTIRDLFRNTLRMRPDRIVVGEVRSAEVIDMLQAMNTGHDGSMSTIHANTPRDVMTRLDSLMLMSGIDIPLRAIREMVSSAIHLIVQTAKFPDGSRKITTITEISGMQEDYSVGLRDIFDYEQTGVDDDGNAIGAFKATGYVPSFLDELHRRGFNVSDEIFRKT
jgi:pilus assembly protein CpaF